MHVYGNERLEYTIVIPMRGRSGALVPNLYITHITLCSYPLAIQHLFPVEGTASVPVSEQ